MSKVECKMKLKHQLDISRRLERAGLYAAAIEYRNRAWILLKTYKHNYLGKPG
jgi:hypothetical protein